MIYFKKLRWKNFLSTGNSFTELDLCKSSTTLIVGSNGAGKSTILDALSFVLYGKPFRKINKPQLLNSINSKQLIVECEFDIGVHKYKIIRGMKPNILEVYQNSKIINQNADAKDYQEMIEKSILKLNHKSFMQVVILGSASFTPFMQLSAAHRREVIEDLLDIQIFTVMNVLLKEKVIQNKDALQECDTNLRLSKQKIDLQKENSEKLKQNNEELINSHKEKLAHAQQLLLENMEQKKSTEIVINNLREQITDHTKVTSKLKKIDDLEYQLRDKKSKLSKEVLFYHDNDSCPTCKQELQHDFKDSKVQVKQKQIEEVETGLEKLKGEKDICYTRLNEIEKIIEEINTNTSSVEYFINQIMIQESVVTLHTNTIASIESQTKKMEDDKTVLEELEANHTTLEKQKKELIEQRTVYEIAGQLLKDTGIKTKIINQYIPVMNKLINKYLASMDFFVNFELNENFEEKIKSRYRDEFSYASFSEGEKLRIDLALLFTWRTIAKLRNSASTNLLIMDEIFDSSLDNSGTEEFLKILETLAQDTNVFIISHKGDQLYDRFESVIKFEKHQSFSRIAA